MQTPQTVQRGRGRFYACGRREAPTFNRTGMQRAVSENARLKRRATPVELTDTPLQPALQCAAAENHESIRRERIGDSPTALRGDGGGRLPPAAPPRPPPPPIPAALGDLGVTKGGGRPLRSDSTARVAPSICPFPRSRAERGVAGI